MLRNFGAAIKIIHLEGELKNQNFCEKSLQLVKRYLCPIKMTIRFYDITENIERLMRPLLLHLQTLDMQFCSLPEAFLNTLPALTPELQEWQICFSYRYTLKKELIRFVISQPKFHKLQKISYTAVAVDNNNFEELLKWNPQLKDIGIHNCQSINDTVFETIVKHVPSIEKISFSRHERNDRHETIESINNENVKYFRQLMNLKSLELVCVAKTKSSSMWAMAVVREIVGAKVPLECLRLHGIDLGDESNQFANAIAKLKKLKTLSLKSVDGLCVSQILEFSKHLSELTEFCFCRSDQESIFSANNLLALISNSKKLRLICYCNYYYVQQKICIGIETYTEMVIAVKNRCVGRELKICLNKSGYDASIPVKLVRTHKDSLTLSIVHKDGHLICQCNGEKLLGILGNSEYTIWFELCSYLERESIVVQNDRRPLTVHIQITNHKTFQLL